MIRRGDRVTVVDPRDEHVGEHGMVVRGEYIGVVSGRTLVDVQLDGRERWDDQGFYVDQLVPSFSVAA